MKNEPELKPCPFCGKTEQLATRVRTDFNFSVYCEFCWTEGPVGWTGLLARAKWDSRAVDMADMKEHSNLCKRVGFTEGFLDGLAIRLRYIPENTAEAMELLRDIALTIHNVVAKIDAEKEAGK